LPKATQNPEKSMSTYISFIQERMVLQSHDTAPVLTDSQVAQEIELSRKSAQVAKDIDVSGGKLKTRKSEGDRRLLSRLAL
jgi:hypothetical protein